MIRSKIYTTVPGNNYVFIPTLIGATILSVDRSGFGQDEEAYEFPPTPVNTGFQRLGARLIFDQNISFNPGEKINVLYEI
jgi:hypothetical protein